MGQKVSPVGLRIGINKDWESKWYAPNKDFAKYLNTDIKIREYLEKNLKGSSVASIVIERNNKRTNIIINTSKPGVVIGRGGEEIEKHKKALAKLTGEDIYISIVEIKQPDLNAALVAEQIAMQIENRVSFRVAQKKAIRNTMKAGAKGIKTLISGRLNGAEIARSEGYNEGTVPLHTLRADIDYAHKEADTIYGKIGVKVWIYKGEILPAKETREVKKMLIPKRTKYRKPHRISYEGKSKGKNVLSFGEYGLVAKEGAYITARQIEAARVAMTREMKKSKRGKVFINIFPHLARTKKPLEVRMGSGKGNVEEWVAVVKEGKIMFEMTDVTEETAREAFRLAGHKLPIKTKFIKKEEVQTNEN